MRKLEIPGIAAAMAAAALAALPAAAADAFDACAAFTQADAEKALGTAAAGEPVNPRARRPKAVMSCTYTGVKDGAPVAASAQFRFARSEAEAQRAFDEARLQLQTKPMLMPGAEAFWSGKNGTMNLRKGRVWLTLTVGSPKVKEREFADAKRLAEALVGRF